MSYITDRQLTQALGAMHPGQVVTVSEIARVNVDFLATFDGLQVRFSIPEDVLQSSPLEYVIKRYLKPVSRRAEDAQMI